MHIFMHTRSIIATFSNDMLYHQQRMSLGFRGGSAAPTYTQYEPRPASYWQRNSGIELKSKPVLQATELATT